MLSPFVLWNRKGNNQSKQMANRFLPSRKWSSARLQVKLGWFDWYPSWQLGVHTPLGMIQLPSKQAGWREFITPGTCSGIKRGDGIGSQLGAPFCPKVSKIIFPWLADWAGHVRRIFSLYPLLAGPGKGGSHRNPQHDLDCIRTSESVMMHLFPTLHTLPMPQH